ncbi:putative helicase [Megavirus lba]|uniref:Putative helicase n=1 Tax=Megavirus lba TaxID=1235314 RepID=L7Y524_9VIRU|nr:putative helicase [Megavirus lba]
MDEINYIELIKIVERSVKRSFMAFVYENGKDVENVANIGAHPGDIVKLERSGEYYGIAVEILGDVKPLLTNKFVIRILTMMKKEDYVTILGVLGLTNMDQLYYILDRWFRIATTDYNNVFKYTNKYPTFDKWISTVAYDPIMAPVKIVEIGLNQVTGESVVPPDWIDREFDSAEDLHYAMSQLPNRVGRSPVTYAIIYTMIIQTTNNLITDLKNIDYDTIFYFDVINGSFQTTQTKKEKPGYEYVKYDNILIGFKLTDILEPKGKITGEHTQSRLKEVGLLVSRLQKSIRRGKYGARALAETIEALNISPNYNLPEHGFLRVSASKQMVWRLFVTIFEDCRPYKPLYEPSLLHLIILVLITQKLLEYRFTNQVLENIKLIALLAQYNDKPIDWYPWQKLEIANISDVVLTKKSDYHNALFMAIHNVIMRKYDNQMLRRYYTIEHGINEFDRPIELQKDYWKKTLSNSKKLLHNKDVYRDIILSSFDMHNKTYITLYYQACQAISMTTREIVGYIWDISSGYNIRSGLPKPPTDNTLVSIQEYFYQQSLDAKMEETNIIESTEPLAALDIPKYINIEPNERARRISFLLLFGNKYKSKNNEIVLAGSISKPIRIKINNEWNWSDDIKYLNDYPRRTVYLTDIDPPFGFAWTKNKVNIEIIEGKPMVDSKYIPLFDASMILKSVAPKINLRANSKILNLVVTILSGREINFETLLDLRQQHVTELVNWIPDNNHMQLINMELITVAYTKIYNQYNNIITIGPISSSGSKMQNSINYLLEGKLWAVFNLFSYLYPDTLKPSGSVNFHIRKSTAGYIHLVNSLEKILFDNKPITGSIPTIKTQLWDHQLESVNKIMSGFRNGIFGFGDSSDVGSGKTLTSLKIATELIHETNRTYSGILVLLPGNKLIKTWKEEIERHAEGFDVIYQENDADIGPIERNTIVITTMGRNRDHPINHKWLLVIIDECLTVQNKNALWTESAWKQSMMAKHLVMMSATFFRTRFDKLYYMLKMLRTGLPERREYLDAILLESIVSKISSSKRKWISNFNYFTLDDETRKLYTQIDRSSMSTEVKFAKMTSLLISSSKTNLVLVNQLSTLIKQMESQKHRCLIYARANEEANFWSQHLNIPIYPEKGQHCIVTYHNGTYGLNDLVIYDTIIMRPPNSDLLPQIKGRLDRFGQQSDNLRIEYFIFKDTIEEGLIIRLNIASQFIHKYIMPLATFYDVSVNYKKYLEQNNELQKID